MLLIPDAECGTAAAAGGVRRRLVWTGRHCSGSFLIALYRNSSGEGAKRGRLARWNAVSAVMRESFYNCDDDVTENDDDDGYDCFNDDSIIGNKDIKNRVR